MNIRNKNTFKTYLPLVIMLLMLLTSLHLMSSAVLQAEYLSRYFFPLLVLTIVGLVVMLAMISWHLLRLLVQLKHKKPGARLTGRMFVIFTIISLAPVSVLYYYSSQFILSGIDSWFNVEIDQAMEDAVELSRASIDLHKKSKLAQTVQVLNDIKDSSKAGLALTLSNYRTKVGADELTLFDVDGRVIASANIDPLKLIPHVLKTRIIRQVRNGTNYIGLDEQEELKNIDDLEITRKLPFDNNNFIQKLFIRVVILDQKNRPYILQAIYPTSANIATLSKNLQIALGRYKELSYLREPLKKNFILTLFLVLLFSVFAAVWTAFVSARRLVEPLSAIAQGTSAVADGDFSHQLPTISGKHEVRFLVDSFNLMTRRLSRAKRETELSRNQLEDQTAYLQTVLGELTTGVITFDEKLYLITLNSAAEEILKMSLLPFLATHIDEIEQAPLKTLIDEIRPTFENDDHCSWHGEVKIQRDERLQILNVAVSDLSLKNKQANGFILVFDDVSGLISAQRDAAWGEVARRLAHEIKNPLTPIQLSAERLRHKYLKTMNKDDAAVLDRATNTIVQQVEAMKTMVNEFSDYAKPSKINPKPILLDSFIANILELYNNTAQIKISLKLDAEGICIEADELRLRQVIHNLIKNAQEAILAKKDPRGQITATTQKIEVDGAFFVEFSVADDGGGFDPECQGQIFEPYVTTKLKGTGLGLAIVNKIIAEHGGKIWGENQETGGAIMTLRLPISATKMVS